MMKTMSKKIICVFMMVCCLLTGMALDATAVKAKTVQGGSITFGQQTTVTLDAGTEYMYSFTTAAKGMLVLNMTCANSVNGGYADITVNIYDSQNNLQWVTVNYASQLKAGETSIVNKIGLNAGNYVIEIIPGSDSYGNFSFSMDSIPDEFIEVCPNGSKELATVLQLNNMYSGSYGEGNYGVNYNGCEDYFAVSLTKGKCYRLCLENEESLGASAGIYMDNPKGDVDGIESYFYGSGLTKYYDFKASYTGTYYIHFDLSSGGRAIDYKVGVMDIVVATPSLKSVKAGKASFTAKYDAVEGTDGYEIQYSAKKNFKKAKTVKVNKQSVVSKKISKLAKNKKYFVRVRAYKVIDSTKIYSKWSKVKTVKVK